jgi:hypothetical protein
MLLRISKNNVQQLATDNASTDSEPKPWQVATAGEDAPLSCTRSSEELLDLR